MSDGLGFGAKRLIEKIVETHWGIKDPNLKKFTFTELLFIMQEFQNEEGKAYQEQKNIHRGHYIFKEFVKLVLYRNLANYDSMVLLSSEKGTGKSSAGIMLCREWCKLIGIRFNPERHIAYTNADVMNKVDSLNHFEPILCDEAVLFATAAEWAKCLSGDTMIKTPSGDIKIKELSGKKDIEVFSFNEKTKKIEVKKAEQCVYTKDAEVYEIELENGKKIKATKEHKFLTKNGWKELQELNDGDDIIGI